ncbi:hypothetical protein [Hymenobacter chitinivorans]|uniref:Uncharacterized protein n=1 Tax=Hymenobacter chitinivorans DSM 11115 TaxID=1121954 RepID=A0A2M9B5U9_9BACT|nr:hypothetical protein [Hymenobacter chitinivorans]PJJ53321.1 hypothetical protein CLV45_3982 [Hymenobacter chitinivorans DSM 11115]
MNDTTLAQQMVAAAPAATRSVSLSTGPKRMAVINGWAAMFRGALGPKDSRANVI